VSLSRYDAIAAVIGDHTDFAIIAGLGSCVFDLVRLTDDADTMFPLDGAMGAAVSTGLGLALARPDLQVLVVTGDGEVLMNLGALATVAVQDPPNLSIVVVDNGLYALTGGQQTHTAHGVDIAGVAAAAGIREVVTCSSTADLAAGAKAVRNTGHTSLVVLKVDATPSVPVPVQRDGVVLRARFQKAFAQAAGEAG
jgi:phosphonopyruvate decarboxylase